MVNEILENWEQITWKWLNTKNEDLTETLDEKKFREYIWENLVEKHTKLEDWKKFWYQWKILRIELPAVWDFEWSNFECFFSDKIVGAKDLKDEKIYEDYLVSNDEINNFSDTIREYMKAYNIKRRYSAHLSDIIKKLIRPQWEGFRLKQNDEDKENNRRRYRNTGYWSGGIFLYDDNDNQMKWHLLLKTS